MAYGVLGFCLAGVVGFFLQDKLVLSERELLIYEYLKAFSLLGIFICLLRK